MKKFILLPLLLCLSLLHAAAELTYLTDWTDDNGVTWRLGLMTPENYYAIMGVTNYGDDVVVPSTAYYGDTPITIEAIEGRSFYNNKTLKTVSLPASIKYIGYQSFSGCSRLTSVGSLAQCSNIGEQAFYECSSLTSVDLQENITLGSKAFYRCESLASIGTLKGATIGSSAFYGCTSLTEVDLSQVQSLGDESFLGCSNLRTIGDLSAFESIGDKTFSGCKNLESVNLSNCKSIGARAFSGCSSLQDVSLPNVTIVGDYAFQGCTAMETLNLPLVQTIGNYAFNNCSSLDAPVITSTALTSIGYRAFSTPGTITLLATTPPTLGGKLPFSSLIVVRVPDEALASYRAADKWSDFKSQILGIGSNLDYEVNVSAYEDKSTLHVVIGEENLPSVVSLKVTGSINGYDIMVMRNKMDNLHYLDLSDANIVANGYQYYTGYHTEDNILGDYSFYGLWKLIKVILPKSITTINDYAFNGCSNLKEVVFQTGLKEIGNSAFKGLNNLKEVVLQTGLETIDNSAFLECSNLNDVVFPTGLETIGDSAFYGCGGLKKIELKSGLKTIGSYAFGCDYDINERYLENPEDPDFVYIFQPREEELIFPEGVETIGQYAFGYNKQLKRVALPSSLKTMGTGVFMGCYKLENISLPTSLGSIPASAFQYCSRLTDVRIPSSITSIGNQAFSGCTNLNDVYTYIVEPTPINMNTFSTYMTATLHVPSTSYYNYWYDTEWSQFRALEEFDAIYESFYINNDFTINDVQGIIHGGEGEEDPDADLNPGSGLIIETSENNPQLLDEVHIKAKGSDVASVITASNMEANKVSFDIEIQGGRWYFLSFPFNVKTANVTAPGEYTFRAYDPEERAEGNVGWQNWVGDLLYAGQGYIFHCAKSGTLSLCVEKEDMDWDAEDRPQALASAPAANQQDASWNFLGNPQTSYVDIDQTGYTQPITVWNGSAYEAVRPGDDTYALAPFEAFFVQKPDNQSEIDFPANGRMTEKQWNEAKQTKAAARRERGANVTRQLVNLTLTDGTNEDKTRVVFNVQTSKDYEMACDAAKFLSADKVPQLYTLDQQQTRYAINERPLGEVQLGYVATADGELTIKAMRMDQPVMLRDNALKITHDLSLGDYTFSTSAGTFNDRFMLVLNGDVTGIGQLRQQTGVSVTAEEGGLYFMGITDQSVNVYSLSGTLLASNVSGGMLSLPKAAYIVKVGNVTTKVLVR